MAELSTKYSVGDFVWDLLTKKKATVIGFTIRKHRTPSGFESATVYEITIPDKWPNNSFRFEEELEKWDG